MDIITPFHASVWYQKTVEKLPRNMPAPVPSNTIHETLLLLFGFQMYESQKTAKNKTTKIL